jgi:hypothetical protein
MENEKESFSDVTPDSLAELLGQAALISPVPRTPAASS